MNRSLTRDPWQGVRRYTSARVALGRAGGSLPTQSMLEFQLAHAEARDAVHQPFDVRQFIADLSPFNHPLITLTSRVTDRRTYLLRPDQGRKLSDPSARQLADRMIPGNECDLSIVLSDGLSARAAHQQIPAVIQRLLPLMSGFTLSAMVIVPFARVAIQDEVGHRMKAKTSLILLGERPGLGASDSLGAYLVHSPRPGLTDADRNCVSNIRPKGLPPEAAAGKIHYLLTQMIRRQISGIGLKDDTPQIRS